VGKLAIKEAKLLLRYT